MIRRDVATVVQDGKWRKLVLECGHTEKRRVSQHGTVPKRVECNECSRIRDRIEQQVGWFLSNAVGCRNHRVLKLFEREGVVQSRKSENTTTVYWKGS